MSAIADQFQELVIAEESPRALDKAIELVERAAGWRDRRSLPRGWIALDAPDEENMRNGSAGERQAQRAMWLLETVPGRLERLGGVPEAQSSLILDTLLLVFHQAYFTLRTNSRSDRAGLLAAFKRYARSLREADRCQVLALTADAEGRGDLAGEYFRQALSATHSDEHDFVTRVQMCWTHLHEQGNLRGAMQLLQDVYPRVQRQDLDEIRSMIDETFEAAMRFAPRQRQKA